MASDYDLEELMTEGQLGDDDITTSGAGSTPPPADADGTDGDATDTTDGDAGDADGTDGGDADGTDGGDADGTDGDATDSRDGDAS